MSAADDWDWQAQREDTEAVWAELAEKYDLPRGIAIALDLHFVASEAGGDKPGFVAALREGEYAVEITRNDEGVETVQATTGTVFDPAAVWAAEEAGTRLALAHGYRPDGWGFWEPDEDQ